MGRTFDTWVFDLDNTLYPASVDLFTQIDTRMKAYISRTLDLGPDEAFRLQKQYYHQYGTSLRGLMLEHGVDPQAFLADVHAIDHSVLAPDPVLRRALERLPGRKVVFTNGSVFHADRVLCALGLRDLFEAIFDIVASDYIPKPHPETYARLIDQLGIDPARAIMVEDLEKNLAPAHALGMTTVLVRNTVHWSSWEGQSTTPETLPHCHHVTDDLAAWLTAWAD
ncbi:pyrimidine 5'-nucleotidase [Pararhodospirillum photometricum]|uniref:Pyrimidine 5-nucleotidase n=1 Tax=Pararhodospirillum photometricum DSM 122 TaxID=1150469 RepID=H6SKC4_PARPM|nr:pyrimidine 5'-nucleotidase [Pararhodospirillum photometricum]CCG08439.1 Pyrimidine 5-nucleotidase [Pararhodospirillum photometricum DSM 122]